MIDNLYTGFMIIFMFIAGMMIGASFITFTEVSSCHENFKSCVNNFEDCIININQTIKNANDWKERSGYWESLALYCISKEGKKDE